MENLSKDQLIEEVLKLSNLSSRLEELTNRFDEFMSKYDVISSDLAIVKNCNSLLASKIIQLEKNLLNSSQYHRREILELSPIPSDIPNDVLEDRICDALSLTGEEVSPADLQACHRMKKKNFVIVKFKCRKLRNKVLSSRKKLADKSEALQNLKLDEKLFVTESMCAENHQLSYYCRKLKRAKKLHSNWFFNNAVNVRVTENGDIKKIYHISDLELLLGLENLEEFIGNLS